GPKLQPSIISVEETRDVALSPELRITALLIPSVLDIVPQGVIDTSKKEMKGEYIMESEESLPGSCLQILLGSCLQILLEGGVYTKVRSFPWDDSPRGEDGKLYSGIGKNKQCPRKLNEQLSALPRNKIIAQQNSSKLENICLAIIASQNCHQQHHLEQEESRTDPYGIRLRMKKDPEGIQRPI
ncbi:hypothetical protein SK128_003387, partial [Halocaridina rubra]